MENCDPFRIGDRIWSEIYGFKMVTGMGYVDGIPDSLEIDYFSRQIVDSHKPKQLLPGIPIPYHHRPTSFFHAVADTDEGMRAAIACGGGLKRKPKVRSRFDFQEGDKVLIVLEDVVEIGTVQCITDDPVDPIIVVDSVGVIRSFTYKGCRFSKNKTPSIIRIFESDSIDTDDVVQCMWMVINEAYKCGWKNSPC